MAQSPSIYPIANLELAFIDKKRLWAAINNIIQNKKLGFHSYQWDKGIFIPFHILNLHFDEAFANGLQQPDIEKAMENNRIELNLQLPSYSQITKVKIHFEEFEKTAKKSIKRFMYQEAKG